MVEVFLSRECVHSSSPVGVLVIRESFRAFDVSQLCFALVVKVLSRVCARCVEGGRAFGDV